MKIDTNKFDFSKAQCQTTKDDVLEIAHTYNEMVTVPINSYEDFINCLIDELVTVHEDIIALGDEIDVHHSSMRFADILMIFHLNKFVEGAMTFEK